MACSTALSVEPDGIGYEQMPHEFAEICTVGLILNLRSFGSENQSIRIKAAQ